MTRHDRALATIIGHTCDVRFGASIDKRQGNGSSESSARVEGVAMDAVDDASLSRWPTF